MIRWVDGDTVVTTQGKVRLIGVDTPERDRCGYARSTSHAKAWAPRGSKITLGDPKSVRNKDDYGRRLRYVLRGGKDIAQSQIVKGAKARYDSLDGYQWHPRQGRYRKADASHVDHCPGGTAGPAPVPAPIVGQPPTGGSGSFPPSGINTCPANAPIKGNRGSPDWIYHLPGQQYYGVTNPEECFATAGGAVAAGYRAAKT